MHRSSNMIFAKSSTAYDIKLIMDKGALDIIRPQWIKDSVAKGVLMPLRKK